MEPLLPLFPLDVVLFPEMFLPLHIFEERYKSMIGECIQEKAPFGVVYAHDEAIEVIGCTADISKIVKRYPDGRMDILAFGIERFQILDLNSDRDYLRGTVAVLHDSEAAVEPSAQSIQHALDLFEEAYRLLNRAEPEHLDMQSSSGLAFRIASVLYLPNPVKQGILTAQSEDERLTLLTLHMEKLIPQVKEAEKASARARSNGNLRHG
jgi:Lon protease-like protein